MVKLTIFYDSRCPLCVKEMRALQARDKDRLIALEDIWQADFVERFPTIDPTDAKRVLHAVDERQRVLTGLDVTAAAWALVGVQYYRCLRWPLIRPIADRAYRFFARHRYTISRLLTGQARLCEDNSCQKIQ
jgi:predicted DCC family thiol-disulfide oxidoreductase YuxK